MKRPTVAIIGAGIFGVSCALELADKADVILFEQNPDIFQGGTYANQYRHHYGFHYPRSAETVQQCLESESSFREVWNEAIDSHNPAYYAVAKSNSKISGTDFLTFCDQFELEYTLESPTDLWLNPEAVDLCLKTTEPVYNYPRLCELARAKLSSKSAITQHFESEVKNVQLLSDGSKEITWQKAGQTEKISVDYVINAMYTNHTLLYHWLNQPAPTLEFRLKELVVVRLPKDTTVQAVTVMDGPFFTLVPMTEPGLFTFGDVARSVHDVVVSKNGHPWGNSSELIRASRFLEMQSAGKFFLPIIESAEYVRSIFTVLPVLPTAADTDERVTAITAHGNGCWSVFEGKIITCVITARAVAKELLSGI